MKRILLDFINDRYPMDRKQFFALLCGVFAMGGLFGFIYETLFYVLNNGCLCRRGTCIGPWIEIYGFGALFIYALCHKVKKHPVVIILMSGLICGALEYTAGWGMYTFMDGRRGWNYNTEIMNWGNVNGFICFRSVAFFAVSGFLLFYAIIPCILWLMEKMGPKMAFRVFVALGAIFLIDIIYNDIFGCVLGLPNSYEFYKGWDIYHYYNEELLH